MFHAEIEAANHCNTRCLHRPHEVMSRQRGRMEWETLETVVRKIRAHVRGERFSLSFSGMGEPLLHPLLPRFIAHASHDAFTGFACNGATLTERNVRAVLAAGLDLIYLSFNGDEPELFGCMMGGIKFDRVLTNLRRAIALARGTRLQINANKPTLPANASRTPRCAPRLSNGNAKSPSSRKRTPRSKQPAAASLNTTPNSPRFARTPGWRALEFARRLSTRLTRQGSAAPVQAHAPTI